MKKWSECISSILLSLVFLSLTMFLCQRGYANDVGHEKETVFDTSRWALTPSLEYSLQGDWFVFGASVDFGVSERDGLLPAGTLFAERDVFQNKDYRAGIYAFGYANVNGRARVQTDFYWNYRPSLGFWYHVSIVARLERHTIVESYVPQEEFSLGH